MKYMTKREFTGVFQKRGKSIIAWVEEVPGVNTQAHTMKEAEENLREALTMVLDYNRKVAMRNQSVPLERKTLRFAVPA
jgi:predicted RNase H-like HicB family nuclease